MEGKINYEVAFRYVVQDAMRWRAACASAVLRECFDTFVMLGGRRCYDASRRVER